ncbi:hypothetical protein [Capnocytophaga canimorsus]|nr:hypothetical protein [Capnocytophaga canimorsus]
MLQKFLALFAINRGGYVKFIGLYVVYAFVNQLKTIFVDNDN